MRQTRIRDVCGALSLFMVEVLAISEHAHVPESSAMHPTRHGFGNDDAYDNDNDDDT